MDIGPSGVRLVQNFHLVWLDGNIDEMHNDDCRNTITKLRQVVNTVNTFIDIDECIDFITDIKEIVFIISSGALGRTTAAVANDMSQVNSIYIFCEEQTRHEQWTKQWPKVKGVFTDITPICEALKQAAQDCDQNSVSMSFVASSNGDPTENQDQLDSSFMYTQIMKEILLTINFEQKHIMEFITYCREQFVGNTSESKTVDKLKKEYRLHQPIWWYTSDCFLHSMLNRALRTMEVDLIIKMGFFIQDLHEQIAQLHSEQHAESDHSTSFTLYRGQGVSSTDFDRLVKTKAGLMSFNNFLSTSLDRAVSLAFAESNQNDPNLIGVLFQITINPSISSTPFANIRDASYYQGEEEILFSMHSIFRIGQIERLDNNPRLWQVDLTLTSDNDPQLRTLTECMREETSPNHKGWLRLGRLLIKLGQFDKAQEVHDILLDQATVLSEKAYLYYYLGMVKVDQGKYTEAVALYEKSVEINQKTLPANHPNLANSYNSIGSVYDKMGEYPKALSCYEKALEIYQKTLPENHPDLATFYDNIGSVYHKMGEYSKALSSHEKALEIFKKTLPGNHPDLATSYNHIGLVYERMGEYLKALSSHEKALEIRQKTLPSNHPGLATSYNNIGSVYEKLSEYSKALSSHEKALEIRQKSLSANHPDLATAYNHIGLVYNNMGEYSKALSYYEKDLEICQKSLPANHPDLATSYNNIGSVYNNMGEYSKALSYYKKALEISQKSLPANHPDLAISYSNIGSVYNNMVEYSKALSSHEKALEIRQKSLPGNHPDLATSYNNIGSVYFMMGEYSKAVSYCERALKIVEHSLPANHPRIELFRNNLEYAKKNCK